MGICSSFTQFAIFCLHWTYCLFSCTWSRWELDELVEFAIHATYLWWERNVSSCVIIQLWRMQSMQVQYLPVSWKREKVEHHQETWIGSLAIKKHVRSTWPVVFFLDKTVTHSCECLKLNTSFSPCAKLTLPHSWLSFTTEDFHRIGYRNFKWIGLISHEKHRIREKFS